jgi:hypothetical protein
MAHAAKIKECIEALSTAVDYYCKQNYKKFEVYAKKVIDLEGEADLIKGNVRAHLPRYILLPVDRGEFLMLLREQDAILDYAEDVAVLMTMRYTAIPKSIQRDFESHVSKVIETAKALEKTVRKFKLVISSVMRGTGRDEVKKMIHEIHQHEWEADQIERRLSKKLFNMKDLDPVAIFHLLKIIDRMDQIANHAENAADRIRAMLAR